MPQKIHTFSVNLRLKTDNLVFSLIFSQEKGSVTRGGDLKRQAADCKSKFNEFFGVHLLFILSL